MKGTKSMKNCNCNIICSCLSDAVNGGFDALESFMSFVPFMLFLFQLFRNHPHAGVSRARDRIPYDPIA